MCNKLQKKIFTVLALPFAFSIFMMSAGMTPAKAAEEAGTVTTDTPAVTANHNGGSKSVSHTPARSGGSKTTTHTSVRNGGNKSSPQASGRNGGDKNAVHASGRNSGSKTAVHAPRSGQTKPRASGTHTGEKTHSQQKNPAPRKTTHQ